MKVKKYFEKRLDYNYQTGDHGLFKNGCHAKQGFK